MWTATREELRLDFAMMEAAHEAFNQHFDIVGEDRAWQAANVVACCPEATADETREAARIQAAAEAAMRYKAGSAETSTRIVFDDSTQAHPKILIPVPRMMWQLMVGGYTRKKRVIRECAKSGRPIMDGSNEVLGPMTHDEAIQFLIWRDIPPGCNNFRVITTDDLPRVAGSVEKGRIFRAAWRLKEAA